VPNNLGSLLTASSISGKNVVAILKVLKFKFL